MPQGAPVEGAPMGHRHHSSNRAHYLLASRHCSGHVLNCGQIIILCQQELAKPSGRVAMQHVLMGKASQVV